MKKSKWVGVLLLLALSVACFSLLGCENRPQANKVTVTFQGEGVTSFVQRIDAGKTAMEPTPPTRTGYRFLGWFADGSDEAFVFETTPINADLTLTAHWEVLEGILTGNGTEQSPYLITDMGTLYAFAHKVNGGEEGYAKAYYRLDADIDLDGAEWTPVGITELNADQTDYDYSKTFGGVFDGNGHTVSNFKITYKMAQNQTGMLGFFGETYQAVITALSVRDFSIAVTSETDSVTAKASAGGIAAYTILSNLSFCSAKGTISATLGAGNMMTAGGLVGEADSGVLETDGDSQAIISYVQNCSADVSIAVSGDESVVTGGLIGNVSPRSGAMGITNCYAQGAVKGGQYAGGLVGYVSGANVSVINCYSAGSVEATCTTVSYAGGLVGFALGDSLIIDSFSLGNVKARGAALGSQYVSYAGGIIGYGTSDDFLYYYAPGLDVHNSFYAGTISRCDRINNLGTQKDASQINADFLSKILGWTTNEWELSVQPKLLAKKDAKISEQYTVTYTGLGDVPAKTVDANAILGVQEPLESVAPYVFYDWCYGSESGAEYRYYMPVVKNLTLVAYYESVEEIAGAYCDPTAEAKGTIYLGKDGTLIWYTDGSTPGSYRYDGEHIIFVVQNSMSEGSGTIIDGVLSFVVPVGTQDIPYNLQKFDPEILGEYIDDDGNLLTFAGPTAVSFESEKYNGGDYIPGTYSITGSTITITGSKLSMFSSMTLTVNGDGTLTANFVAAASGGNITTTFTRAVSDYTGEAVLGEYDVLWLNGNADGTNYTLTLLKDGTLKYTSKYSTTMGRFYYVASSKTVKVILEGNVCNLKYDADKDVLYGSFSRGTGTNRYIVIPKKSDKIARYFVFDDGVSDSYKNSLLIVTESGKKYLAYQRAYLKDAVITGTFENRQKVSINGADYIVVGSYLKKVGDEVGTYNGSAGRVVLDGIGGVTGDKTGTYKVYDKNVIIVFDDDTMLAFAFDAAQAASNAYTALTPDAFAGVYYGTRTIEQVIHNNYFRLVIDGFGHTSIYYQRWSDETNAYEYALYWQGTETYTKLNDIAISVQFNSYNGGTLVFYYDNNLAYSAALGSMGRQTFVKKGYTGTTDVPSVSAAYVGAWHGTIADKKATLNIRSDATGLYRGSAFAGLYDGNNKIFFTLAEEDYVLVLGNGKVTVTDSAGNVITEMERGSGEDTGAIPGAYVGSWKGMIGGSNAGERTWEIQANGSGKFNGTLFVNATYNADENVVTGKVSNTTFTAIYNEITDTIFFSWKSDVGEGSGTMSRVTKA